MSGISDHPRRSRALHPPLTDFPIAAYVFAAAFDVISVIGGPHRTWAEQFWHAGTFVLVGGLSLCLLTMVTGFIDLLSFPGHHPGASRTVVSHVTVMAVVFMIGSADIAWRIAEYHSHTSTPVGILIVSLAAAAGVCVGAAHGGTLVFRHGVGVAVGVGVQADARSPAGAAVPVQAAAPVTPAQAARHRLRRGR